MGSHIHRAGRVAAFLGLFLAGASRVAVAQIPVGELQRPDVGVRDFFGGSMDCDDITLVVSSARGVDVFEVVEDGARWMQRLLPDQVQAKGVEPFAFYAPAVHGDWFAVQDTIATVNGILYAGAVHVFHRDGGHWAYAQTLLAKVPAQQGDFGRSLAFDGTTLVIGSPKEDAHRGAVHLYEVRSGSWTKVQTLVGLQPKSDFGSGVSVDGRWLLVGAAHESGGTPKGQAHFFERAGTEPLAPWVLRQSFEGPGDIFGSNWFGFDLELRVPHAMAADTGDQNVGLQPALGVVTFALAEDGTWHETGLLNEPEVGFYGPNVLFFGSAMSLRGDELLIGSPLFYDLQYSGAVFRFRLVEGAWEYAGKLVPTTPKVEGRFGQAIAHAPGLVFVGAPWKDLTCTTDPFWGFDICYAKGTAHVFRTTEDATQFCSCPTAPCGNPDNHGGCANLKGFGGVLASAGSGSVGLDDLELMAWSLPGGAPVLLLVGDVGLSLPFGDGRLCLTGSMLRLASQPADLRGHANLGTGLVGVATAAGHPALPGSSAAFQVLYRDPPGPCGTGINLTNAVRVDFKP